MNRRKWIEEYKKSLEKNTEDTLDYDDKVDVFYSKCLYQQMVFSLWLLMTSTPLPQQEL